MIDLNVLTGWMLTMLVTMSPTGKTYNPPDVEDPAATRVRLESISRDIVSVAFDEKEVPLFPGPHGRELSAVFIAASAAAESGGFLKSVDSGTKQGDHGRSWCIMQINLGKGKTPEGWHGNDLIKDRKKCIKTGYRIMRSSMATCKGNVRDSMAAYLSGNCRVGIVSSRSRYDHAMKLYRKYPLQKFIELNSANDSDTLSMQFLKRKIKKTI